MPNNCYVNDAILIIQSIQISYTDKCKIYFGKWISPYTNNLIITKSDIDIDHIVPLKNAWNSGANSWTQNKRVDYANSKNNLLISEKSLNRQKGNKTPDKWLPQINKCGYIVKWIYIKFDYKLTITKSKKETLNTKINTC